MGTIVTGGIKRANQGIIVLSTGTQISIFEENPAEKSKIPSKTFF